MESIRTYKLSTYLYYRICKWEMIPVGDQRNRKTKEAYYNVSDLQFADVWLGRYIIVVVNVEQ